MKLEDQVCSLELVKRLKKLGVKQESYFYWNTWGDGNGNPYITHSRGGLIDDMGPYLVSAFTVAELGDMLPETFTDDEDGSEYILYFYPRGVEHYVGYRHELEDGNWDTVEVEQASTEADARAKMLIYLLENKLISL